MQCGVAFQDTSSVAVHPRDDVRLNNVYRRGTGHGQEVGRYGREVVRRPPAGVSVPAAKEVWTADRTNAVPLLQGSRRPTRPLRKGEEVRVR